jgi:hypothetical protein
MSTPTVELDGQQWIQRAGRLWGTYKTTQSYLGFCSTGSVIAFASRHNLKRLKHGKLTIVSKDQIDAITGAGKSA